MAYREDSDLRFLGELKSEDLNDLVTCLTHDKDGQVRLTEELTMSDAYKRHYPDHRQYWQAVAAEVQCFGANTLATMFRGGKGVPYREVLCDVCDKMKVNYNAEASVERIENNLLMKILTDAIEHMGDAERRELVASMGVAHQGSVTPQVLTGIFQAIFRAGGFKSFQLTAIVVNAILKALIGRGLAFGGGAVVMRTAAILTGPIGWAATGLWTAVDIASPAYRVTIPAVIQIAFLRQKHLYAQQAEDVTFA